MLNWVDLAIVGIFILATALEVKRGFGKASFDFIALLLTVTGIPMILGGLSKTVKLSQDPSANEALVYALSFIVIGGVFLFLGKLVYDSILISLEPFDTALGALFGVGVAIIIGHVLVRALTLGAGGDVPPTVVNSAFGMELLTFSTYHDILDSLYNFNR